MPSTPADAKGLLKAAARDPGPVVVIESLAVWGLKGEAPEGDHVAPIGEAAVVRGGDDITLVSWGGAVQRTVAAAELLVAEDGIWRRCSTWNASAAGDGAILRSLEKTGRIATRARRRLAVRRRREAAAIAARRRASCTACAAWPVTAPFAPVPSAALEAAYYPQCRGHRERCTRGARMIKVLSVFGDDPAAGEHEDAALALDGLRGTRCPPALATRAMRRTRAMRPPGRRRGDRDAYGRRCAPSA